MIREKAAVQVGAIDIVRFFLELFAFFSLCFWGFATWPFAWNILMGIAAPVTAIALWALFRSPRAMIPIGVFGKALVEIAVMASAALAWVGLDQPIVAAVFAVTATVTGVVSGWKELD